jgi:hypothetical protein
MLSITAQSGTALHQRAASAGDAGVTATSTGFIGTAGMPQSCPKFEQDKILTL